MSETEERSIPILCPVCNSQLGSVLANGVYLIRQAHHKALVREVIQIQCRKSLELHGSRMHCPGVWKPDGESHGEESTPRNEASD